MRQELLKKQAVILEKEVAEEEMTDLNCQEIKNNNNGNLAKNDQNHIKIEE